ncbi:hypothetical protein PC116_g24713 [Phytophthora cactorum]|uniref:Uncharacterized protein n=1 Tax=Phytophthora cactorum TaxID=29920 RepID=A0A8T1B7T0_9STRA|nr:hypothetical protein Pcac1_g6140 [Phytophthora cactorum]KAG2883485.1 hypothetical protein PC114_g20570 [Phytophthora cactorum]KAG2896590.1 hypothetical protein PC117_g22956 [Phytophthora cactorum]KAG2974214.1 hypothetical protein PC119_g22730 [Phytophthora cactorum]KAG4226887.1 hypothetical protein PC116_g24713 [Phytophthora cactorum]
MPSLAGVQAPQPSTELIQAVVLGLGGAFSSVPRRTHPLASAKRLVPARSGSFVSASEH